MTEHDNLARQGAYEVWYLTWNDAAGRGYWLRYTTEGPRGEMWFARFDPAQPSRTFGFHRRFDGFGASREPFGLDIGTSHLGHDRARGELVGAGHTVRWDLRWDPAPATLRQLPRVMYARGGLGETTVLSPNPRVLLAGTIDIDGELVSCDGCVAGQTHLWGRKHAYSWAWGRCAELADGAVLELLAVRLQRRGITLPPLALVTLWLDGERHDLNQFRHVVRNRGSWRTGHVAFSAWSPFMRVEGELSCAPEQLVATPYEDPDGTHVWCHNTEIGDARVTIHRRGREPRVLESRGRAHFETGGRERDPAVVREHLLV